MLGADAVPFEVGKMLYNAYDDIADDGEPWSAKGRGLTMASFANPSKTVTGKMEAEKQKTPLAGTPNLPQPDTNIENLVNKRNMLPHSPTAQMSPLVGDPLGVKAPLKKAQQDPHSITYGTDDQGRITITDVAGVNKGYLDFGSPEANAAMLKKMQDSRGTVTTGFPMKDWGGGYNRAKLAMVTPAQGSGSDYMDVPEVNTKGTWGDFIKSVNARKSAIRGNNMALEQYKTDQANATDRMKVDNQQRLVEMQAARIDRQFDYNKEKDSIAAKYQQTKDERDEAEKTSKFYQKQGVDRFNQVEKIYGADTGAFFGFLQTLPKELGINTDLRLMSDRELGLVMDAFNQAKGAVAATKIDWWPFNEPNNEGLEVKRQTHENLKRMKEFSSE
jgi:hypothetical protein